MTFFSKIPLALKILIPGVAIVFVVATAKPKPQPAPPVETPVVKTQVETVSVEKTTQTVLLESQGTVEPQRSSQLMPQVSGKIVKLANNFADGGVFSANQILIELDDSNYQVALAQAQSALAEAQMQLATEQAQSQEAQRQWQELGNAAANALFKREPQLAAAQAKFAAAQANVTKAKLDLTRTKISLPFTGRIENIQVGIGQFVGTGTTLATVYDTSKVQIKLPLTEKQTGLIDLSILQLSQQPKQNSTVEITSFYAGQQHLWFGQIERIGARLDNNTRMLDLIVTLEQSQQISQQGLPILVGMFVNGKITSKPIEQLIQLPKQALFKRNQIYLVDDNSKVLQQQVEVIAKSTDTVWITAQQIANGSQVIINKLGFLSPGTDVTTQAETPATAQLTDAN
ncbi:efflux RND transporter periplasmic adaptor subunit [Catenovulum sp. SX2]|uniref:efflux RND transporter periplasmic adaptor subunit n=1 Tax=Catenovulum sp. SX2 TaxID=3398614 RepID=UPI003F855F58